MGRTVYSCPFFNKINSDGSFHIPENSLREILYWLLHPKLFFTGESVFPLHELSFRHRLAVANLYLAHLWRSFYHKWFTDISYIFLSLSHGLHFSSTKNLITDPCSSMGHSALFFVTQHISMRWKYFWLSINSKQFWKKKRIYFKKFPLFIKWPLYILPLP